MFTVRVAHVGAPVEEQEASCTVRVPFSRRRSVPAPAGHASTMHGARRPGWARPRAPGAAGQPQGLPVTMLTRLW